MSIRSLGSGLGRLPPLDHRVIAGVHEIVGRPGPVNATVHLHRPEQHGQHDGGQEDEEKGDEPDADPVSVPGAGLTCL